jgi:hypothetical protein
MYISGVGRVSGNSFQALLYTGRTVATVRYEDHPGPQSYFEPAHPGGFFYAQDVWYVAGGRMPGATNAQDVWCVAGRGAA